MISCNTTSMYDALGKKKHSMNLFLKQRDLYLHQEWTSPWWGSRSCPWWPRRRGWAWGSCRGRRRTRRTRRSVCSRTPCKILRRGQPQLLIYYVKKWSLWMRKRDEEANVSNVWQKSTKQEFGELIWKVTFPGSSSSPVVMFLFKDPGSHGLPWWGSCSFCCCCCWWTLWLWLCGSKDAGDRDGGNNSIKIMIMSDKR